MLIMNIRKPRTISKKSLLGMLVMAIITIETIATPVPASASESGWYDTDNENHSELDYSEMKYTGIDEEVIRSNLEDIRDAVKEKDPDKLIGAYDEMCRIGEDFETQNTLNSIRYYDDIYNDEYADLDVYFTEFGTEYYDELSIAVRDALKSDTGGALKEHIGDEDIVEEFLEYEDMSPEEKALSSEFTRLSQEYDRQVMDEFHLTIDGEDWTIDRLQEEANSLGYDTYMDYIHQIYTAQNETLARIYIDIVKNRNALAAFHDYDNYADFAYEEVYNRDYTTDDIKDFYEGVQSYMVPLYQELEEKSGFNYQLDNMDLTGEERLDRVGAVIPKIHPELQESWDYMISHHLYDIEASDTKMDKGFTAVLGSYGAPFFFDSPYGTWQDLQTVIHEFGHYNNAYHVQYGFIDEGNNMDVAEIQSQGLELLCLEFAEEVYGEANADEARIRVLKDMVSNVLEGCIYDEFQYRAYNYDGELTVEVLNDIFEEVYLSYYPDDEYIDFDRLTWVYIPHTFDSPMYFVSYGTSALAALDVFAMSTEDRQAGIDCYMNLTTYGWETGYREVLDDVGLPDVFEPSNVEDIAIAIRDYTDDLQTGSMVAAILITVSVFVGIVAIIVIIIVLVVHSRRTKARRRGELSI